MVGALSLGAAIVLTGDVLQERIGPQVLCLAALALLGEFVTIRVFRRGAEGEITLSTAFSYAVLLAGGTLAAALALGLASLAADVHARKPAHRIAFNVAQYVIAMCAAGAVVAALSDVPHMGHPTFHASELPVIFFGALVFFVLNSLLVAIVVALAHGYPVFSYFREDFAFVAATAGVPLGIAPVAVVSSEFSLVLLPTLALPLVGVQRAARQAMQLEHQSQHDSLTGLPNRALLGARLESAMRRPAGDVAVLFLDLDHFKDINDALGHVHGDLLLVQVAQRLQEAAREGDTVARLGGDEFAALLPDTGPEEARGVARRLLAALDRPIEVEGVMLSVEASVGIAVAPDDGDDAETLMRRADIAMYVAKGGKTGIESYDPQQEQHSPARLSLAAELRRALDDGELVVHYQPKARLATGAVVGVEALVRWQHPRRGLLLPGEFVPLAENTGLIGPLTMTVLDASLAQLRAWDEEGLLLTVAVNLSTRSLLDRALPERVGRMLAEHGVHGSRLELEITESMIAADPARALAVLEALRALDVILTIDDFGTGYSSLANLRELPVRQLKLDKSFILGMAESESDAIIVRSTVELAARLGLSTVAEGVERPEAWRRLLAMGCDLAQGNLLSPPVPADELRRWMVDGHSVESVA